MRSTCIAALLAAAALSGAASAQTLPRGFGGLANGLGGAGNIANLVPAIGSAGAGNAAGLLSYCVKNRLFGGQDQQAAAGSVLGQLSGHSQVTGSRGYQQGQSGQLLGANGSAVSIAGIKDQVKMKACDLILNRARGFL